MNERVPDSSGLPLRAMVMVLLFLGVVFLLLVWQALGSSPNSEDDSSAISTMTTTTEVGLSIVDTSAGRVLVSPSRAFDGEWVSTFSPGTPFAIAVAIQTLTACLPDGQWFPGQRVSRDFSTQSS